MSWEALDPAWTDADVDARRVWAQCGGAWLTAPDVAVPVEVVGAVVGMTRYLDGRGAGLADLVGADGAGAIGERAAALALPPSGLVGGCPASCGGASRILRCADGWLVATLARDDDLAAIPAWLGISPVGPHWPAVASAVKPRASAEVIEQATLLGLACACLGEITSTRPVMVRRLGAAAPCSLDGLVVANLSSLWAGPFAGDVLARLGARVIKIESRQRPDGARRAARFFNALHGRCESVTLPIGTDEGRRQLAELLSRVDIVIEGSRPRALRQLGIDPETLTGMSPRIWVSITGYGREGHAAQRIGFGDDAAVAGGLVGWLEEQPMFLADALADPITGMMVAATIAQLTSRGGRWLVDIPLARVAASIMPVRGRRTVKQDRPPERPRVRTDPGRPLPIGQDTDAVLREFVIGPPGRRSGAGD